MALNKESNGYIFGFAILMVVVVGAALAIAAMALKPYQQANQAKKKMADILSAMQIDATRDKAPELFKEHIQKRIILNHEGKVVSEKTGEVDIKDPNDAFNVDIRAQYRDKQMKPEDKQFPVFEGQKNGEHLYIIPVAGKGLWGPIWGYVCLKSDLNTIYGTTFGDESETPGLGAEIAEKPFQLQYVGKTIYDKDGKLVGVEAKKGGAAPDNPHAVDALTGATITSRGVNEMLSRTLEVYNDYFKSQQANTKQAQLVN